MSPEEIQMAIKIAVVPLVVAFLVVVVVTRLLQRKGDASSRAAAWPGVLAVGVGMVTGQLLYFGVHIPDGIRLVEGWQWLLLFAVVSIVLLPASQFPRPRKWLGEALRIVVFTAFVVMSVRALASMDRATSIKWIAGATIGCSLWATGLSVVGPRTAGRLWPGILAIVCTVSAVSLFLLHSARNFLLTGALAAALGGVLFGQLVWRRKPSIVANGGGNYPLLVLAGLLLVHALYVDEASLTTMLILMAAPLGVVIGLVPPIRRRHVALAGAIQIAAVLAILAFAIVPLILNYEPDPYAGY